MVKVSEAVKQSCVSHLFSIFGGTSPVEATGIGVSEKLVILIHSLTNREMARLIKAYSNEIIQVSIDIDRLEDVVGKVKRSCAEDNDAYEFIRLGASTPLMVKLFGMQSLEVTALRKAMDIDINSGGRPRCSQEERDDILAIWKEYPQLDERKRYLAVAKKAKLSLKVVHMVIMQECVDSRPLHQAKSVLA